MMPRDQRTPRRRLFYSRLRSMKSITDNKLNPVVLIHACCTVNRLESLKDGLFFLQRFSGSVLLHKLDIWI
jgi:hypothetical protein